MSEQDKEQFKPFGPFDALVNQCGVIVRAKDRYVYKQQTCRIGYKHINLIDHNKTRKRISVHRAVAMAFLNNKNGYPDVNHKDGIKINNHVSNLEWCTRSYNQKHAYDMGLNRPPDTRKDQKRRAVLALRAANFTISDIADAFECSTPAIIQMIKRTSPAQEK